MKMGNKNCKSSNFFNSAITTLFSQSVTRQVGGGRGSVHCQPTSVSRRKSGVPRGVVPVGKGHKKGNLLEKAAKRKNDLALNISQNVPNAKKH